MLLQLLLLRLCLHWSGLGRGRNGGLLCCIGLLVDVVLKVLGGKRLDLFLLLSSLAGSLLLGQEDGGVSVDPVLDGLERPVTLVLNGVVLLIGGEEKDGRVTLEGWVHVGNVVGSAVHLAEDDVLVVLQHLLSHLLVDRLEVLAMAAPWSVDEEDGVLLDLVDFGVVVVGHDHLDGALLLLRNRLRLHVGWNLSVFQVVNKVSLNR